MPSPCLPCAPLSAVILGQTLGQPGLARPSICWETVRHYCFFISAGTDSLGLLVRYQPAQLVY